MRWINFAIMLMKMLIFTRIKPKDGMIRIF